MIRLHVTLACATVGAALILGCAAPAATADRRPSTGSSALVRAARKPGAAGHATAAQRTAAALDPSCQLGAAPRSLTPSTECIGCHDGTEAAVRGSTSHHPFANDYEAARQRGMPLRPFPDVPAEIVLVGGEVACTSCHAASSGEPAHVALSMRGSGLCLGCHPR